MAATVTTTATNLLLFRRPVLHSSATVFPLFYRPIPSFSLHPLRALNGAVSTPIKLKSLLNEEFNSVEDENSELKENKKKKEDGFKNVLETTRKIPVLTVKEKKELGSYANSLGDKLKSQQVGKSGVTDNLIFALSETLEANELLKLKIHRSCPGEVDDVVRQLEQATGSVVVGQICRTVILYRPSLAKLKAEEKKEQARKLFAEKRKRAQAAFMKREQLSSHPVRFRSGNRTPERVPS